MEKFYGKPVAPAGQVAPMDISYLGSDEVYNYLRGQSWADSAVAQASCENGFKITTHDNLGTIEIINTLNAPCDDCKVLDREFCSHQFALDEICVMIMEKAECVKNEADLDIIATDLQAKMRAEVMNNAYLSGSNSLLNTITSAQGAVVMNAYSTTNYSDLIAYQISILENRQNGAGLSYKIVVTNGIKSVLRRYATEGLYGFSIGANGGVFYNGMHEVLASNGLTTANIAGTTPIYFIPEMSAGVAVIEILNENGSPLFIKSADCPIGKANYGYAARSGIILRNLSLFGRIDNVSMPYGAATFNGVSSAFGIRSPHVAY